MSSDTVDTTWGDSLVATGPKPLGITRTGPKGTLFGELLAFVGAEIARWRPDLVVAVERRGTAILRALMESSERGLDLSWEKVVSSHSVAQLPRKTLRKSRILVFDDMCRHGLHLRRVLSDIAGKDTDSGDLQKRVRVAVFAMHEDATWHSAFGDFGVQLGWVYRGLTAAAYRNKRTRILRLLQQRGSLMLDTEHLEFRVQVRRSFNEFLEALSRRTRTVTFHSLGNRRNVTVFYDDDDPAYELPRDRLPTGSITRNIVKKCRVVERGPNEYAVIPICCPTIPDSREPWPRYENDKAMLGGVENLSGTARFYGVALVSALVVLEWVLKSLYAAGDQVRIYLPTRQDSARGSENCTLAHLPAMYPNVKLDELADEMAAVDARASLVGVRIRSHGTPPSPQLQVGDEELRRDSWSLLQIVRDVLDDRMCEKRLFEPGWKVPHPFGLTAAEVFAIGDRFGWSREKTSALFDLLIDDGHLVTHVDSLTDPTLGPQLARVFQPDGEMVSKLVRLYSMQRGLPDGY